MTPTSDKKMANFMWIVGTILVIFCGAGLTVALSYGGTRNQVEVNNERISKLERTSVNYIYLEELVQSNLLIVDVLKAKPNSPEMDEALKDWRDFQINTMKKANPTRGTDNGKNF